MSRFVCFLPEPEYCGEHADVRWSRISPTGTLLASGIAALQSLKGFCGEQDQLVAVVPGERVTLHRVTLPMRSRAALVRALPFALEESLSEDIESLHIVAGKRDARGILAAVVAHRDMEAWLLGLHAAGLEPRWMFPDSLLLPVAAPGVFSILPCSRGRCIVRAEDSEPVVVAEDLCELWQQHEEQRLGKTLQRNRLSAGVGDAGAGAAAGAGDPGVHAPGGSGAATADAVLLRELRSPMPLNLLTGRYAGRNKAVSDWRPWRIPAALTLCAAILWLVSLMLELRQLERAVMALEDATETLFRETLPDTRMVDPVRQFGQFLEQQTAAADGPGPVLVRFAALVDVVAGEEMSLRHIRADADRLELELDIDSLASLERFRSRLVNAGAYEVNILSADTGSEGIRARLQIGDLRS